MIPEEIISRAVLFVGTVGAGTLILWTAKATSSGRLKRNPVAGIRLAVTMASDRAWLAAHQAARRSMETAGWCAIVGGVPSLLPVPLPFMLVSALTGVIAMTVLVLRGANVGARAARAAE